MWASKSVRRPHSHPVPLAPRAIRCAVVVLVVVMTFRSLGRWQQPPRVHTREADWAESYLDWQTHSHGDGST
jgi:hypothetical protein